MTGRISFCRQSANIAVLLVLLPAVARAQSSRDVPHAGQIQMDVGFAWTGGYSPNALAATETSNPSVRTSPLTLFDASPKVGNAPGLAAHLGVYLTPRWSVEGGFQFARPKLTVRATNDFEAAADTTIQEVVTQYLIEGSVLYQFARLRSGRGSPFVVGGAGYLRDVDEDAAHVETGTEVHAGGGFMYWLGRNAGLRVEGRMSARSHSIDVGAESKRRIVPTVLGTFAYRF
jgi:hypothetical protein